MARPVLPLRPPVHLSSNGHLQRLHLLPDLPQPAPRRFSAFTHRTPKYPLHRLFDHHDPQHRPQRRAAQVLHVPRPVGGKRASEQDLWVGGFLYGGDIVGDTRVGCCRDGLLGGVVPPHGPAPRVCLCLCLCLCRVRFWRRCSGVGSLRLANDHPLFSLHRILGAMDLFVRALVCGDHQRLAVLFGHLLFVQWSGGILGTD